MPTVRYQVDEVPLGANAHAFFPMPSLSPAGSSHGLVHVFGAPGTERVPSPRPAGALAMSPSPAWQSRSASAPDWFAPQLGIASPKNMQPPVFWTVNDSRIPTPIGEYNRVARPVQAGRKVGGISAQWWPKAVPRFPNLLRGRVTPGDA